MKQSIDPVRWSEQHDSALPDELIRGLKGYAEQGPSQAQRQRMAERLAVNVAMGATPRSIRIATGAWARWGVGALLIAGLGGLAAHLHTAKEPVPQRAAVVVDAAPAGPAAAHPALAPAPARERVEPVVRTNKEHPPKQEHPPKRHAVRANRAVEQTTLAAVDPGVELRLLAPARQLLAAQPARALALANEHARAFPNGVFAEERQVLTIEALARTGQGAEAEQEARSFRRRHPRSSYLERVTQALDAHEP